MPAPTKPTLAINVTSNATFIATVAGDTGVTNRLFYRKSGTTADTTGPTRVGNGAISVNGLTPNAGYIVWAVADNGQYSLPAVLVISLAVSAIDPDTVVGAVVKRFTDDDTLTALVPAGLWTGQVPEDQSVPWAVVALLSEVPEWTTERDYTVDAMFQIVIFAKGAATVEGIIAACKHRFDWCELAFVNGKCIKTERTNYTLIPEDVRASDGALIYRGTLDYTTQVRRTY